MTPNQAKRVLYVLNSQVILGGASIGLFQLLKYLPRERFKAYVVLPAQPSQSEMAMLQEWVDGVEVVRFSGWTRYSELPLWKQVLIEASANRHTWFHLRPIRNIANLIERLDIDLVYTNSALVIDAALAAKLRQRPHVWHVKEWLGRGGSAHFWIPDFAVYRTVLGLSTRVVTMSHYLADLFPGPWQPPKIRTIYDGVDSQQFDCPGSGLALRRQLGIADDELVVGAVGSLTSSVKRFDIFVEMAIRLAQQFPRVRFVHFGPQVTQSRHRLYNSSWLRYQSFQQKLNDSGLSERFIWAGSCPVEDIPKMMDAIDILVHPCDVEGFGRVAVEAMAARRPVVGPARGGIAESVVDGETGYLVPPGDISAFAVATEKLLCDPVLRRDMGQRGRARVETEFSVEQHVTQMLDLFKEVLA